MDWRLCCIQIEGSPEDMEPLLLIIEKYMIKVRKELDKPKKKN